MIACIVSCSEVEGEVKFKARLAAIVSVPSKFVGVVSSCGIGSTVTVGGSTVTLSMDVLCIPTDGANCGEVVWKYSFGLGGRS